MPRESAPLLRQRRIKRAERERERERARGAKLVTCRAVISESALRGSPCEMFRSLFVAFCPNRVVVVVVVVVELRERGVRNRA